MNIYRQSQLYTFLRYCNSVDKKRCILDCGAGGNMPPLGIFKEAGYDTTGIEISERALKMSKDFQDHKKLDLNIIKGDMKNLQFKDESFSFAYSYNTIFHMSREDIIESVKEMKRVVEKDGLIFLNFVSIEDERYEKGEFVREKEYLELEHGEKVLHCYFEENDGEKIFQELNMKIIFKEHRKRRIEESNGKYINLSFIDYIVRK